MLYRKTRDELAKKALKSPGVRKAYDDLEAEFVLLREMIKVRYIAGKTQEEVAKSMGTTTSVVGRLETCGNRQRHSPTLATLRRYARALGYDLQLRFVPH
jgi:hypothetical protein